MTKYLEFSLVGLVCRRNCFVLKFIDVQKVLFSLDNSHNNADKTKSTEPECDISCAKRDYLRLLTVHTSPTQ